MRQALVNENADMCAVDDRYVMRITANDEAGVKQLDNFRNVESTYPVLVTTSKLLSTGVDVQTVKYQSRYPQRRCRGVSYRAAAGIAKEQAHRLLIHKTVS